MHLRHAIREAHKARHKQHRHGALLIRGGNILAKAHNFDTIHAEAAVIGRAWRSGAEGATLVVVRLTKGGTLGMSKPCPKCQQAIEAAGIKKVFYTNDSGLLESMDTIA